MLNNQGHELVKSALKRVIFKKISNCREYAVLFVILP